MQRRILLITACWLACIGSACAGSPEESRAPAVLTTTGPVGTNAVISPKGSTSGGDRAAVRSSNPAESRDAATASAAMDEAAQEAAAEDAEPEAYDWDEAAVAAAPVPMFGAMLLYRVSKHDAFDQAFDLQLADRKQAGIVAQGVMRGVDEPALVAVWLAVTDVARAKAFFANRALQDRIKSTGLLGKRELRLWSNVDVKMEPGKRNLVAALIAVRVNSFAAFKRAFDAKAAERAAAGVVGYSLSQDVDDEQIAYLYVQSDDRARLKAFVAAKETKQLWKDAGVKGAPAITLVQEGEMTLYP
jgi:quinol monooxygenase YgiN